MAEQRDSEAIMRASLAAIDGIRARITWGGYAAVAATLGAFWWLDHVASTSTSTNRLVMAAVLAMTCVVAWSTFRDGDLRHADDQTHPPRDRSRGKNLLSRSA